MYCHQAISSKNSVVLYYYNCITSLVNVLPKCGIRKADLCLKSSEAVNKQKILTVSSESAPSSENFVSPVTSLSSVKANCFLTIALTLLTVSVLACLRTQNASYNDMLQKLKGTTTEIPR